MTTSSIDRADVRLIAGGAIVYVLLLASGALTSPLLPLASVWLFHAALDVERRRMIAYFAGAALLLIATEALREDLGWRDVAALTAVIAAAWLPLQLLRLRATRDRRRLAQLDRILAEADAPERPTPEGVALTHLRDLEHTLLDLSVRVQARRVILWRVERAAGLTRPVATSAGPLPGAPVQLRGSPLGWVWEEGVQMQIEPPPSWAAADALVVAARLRADGTLLTYEFAGDAARPAADRLDAAAATVRSLLDTHEMQLAAVGDRRRLDGLMGALRKIPAEPDLDAVAHELLQAARGLLETTGGAIALWDGEDSRVLLADSSDGGPESGRTAISADSEMAIAARAETRIVREDRRRTAPPVASRDERWVHAPRALVTVPLRAPSGVVGLLALWTSEYARFDEQSVELVDAAAPYFALVLNHARQYGMARERAERDPLTKLRNRRAFDAALDAENARFQRYERPLSVMLVDLDHFKQINDTHGHEAGDAVLQLVARTLELELRDNDIPARFGGEEFVVLLPETDRSHAHDAAERLRGAIERLDFQWQGRAIPIRASIGVASCPDCANSPHDLIGAADEALYKAKENGRNQVRVAPLKRRYEPR